jgi:N-methylhydantoinase B
VLGALSQAMPQQIPAAGAGQVAIVLLSHLDGETGTYKVNVLQPMQGGCGGRPTKDGIDGVNFSAGSLRNVPTESIELEAPVFVRRYMLRDEAAPGKWRGGAGVVFEFEINAPNTIITARGMERLRLRPWGRAGAGPGEVSGTVVNPGTPDEQVVGKIDVLKLAPGDVVRIVSPGGGGYGDPFERDPEMVRQDVANGFVSAADAAAVYGVVLRDGAAVDLDATRRRRLERAPVTTAPFSYGREREEYERRLPPAVQDVVAAELLAYSGSYRHFLKERVYDALLANGAVELDAVLLRERIRAIVKTIRTKP